MNQNFILLNNYFKQMLKTVKHVLSLKTKTIIIFNTNNTTSKKVLIFQYFNHFSEHKSNLVIIKTSKLMSNKKIFHLIELI
jgi:hypothetical protein